MQMVKKILLIALIVWIAMIGFMPKAEFYHTLEKALQTQEVKFNEKEIDEGLFSLTVRDITVYVKGIALAHIDKITFNTYLFYTSMTIDNLMIDESLHTKVPAQTKKMKVGHTLLSPLILSIDANGTFGLINGEIDIVDRQVQINFIKTKDISMLKSFLIKGEKGWSYEKSF